MVTEVLLDFRLVPVEQRLALAEVEVDLLVAVCRGELADVLRLELLDNGILCMYVHVCVVVYACANMCICMCVLLWTSVCMCVCECMTIYIYLWRFVYIYI